MFYILGVFVKIFLNIYYVLVIVDSGFIYVILISYIYYIYKIREFFEIRDYVLLVIVLFVFYIV